ncbi:MAG: hypothetical protein KIT09_33030 [Bryobacteraceae bacterium]|nr:hypothetical protein [Bryobacteraceae bacterium]
MSEDNLYFAYSAGATPPPSQNLSVSTEDEELEFTVSVASGPWLSVQPSGGETPATLRVSVNPSGLAPGTYVDLITLTAGNSARTVTVSLFIANTKYRLIATPAIISFVVGPDDDERVQTRIATVSSAVSETTRFTTAFFGGGWLSARPASGITPSPIEITADPAGLASGVYTGLVNIVDPEGQVAFTIRVTLNVTGAEPIQLSPDDLFFSAALGSATPQSATVLASSGLEQAINFTVGVSTSTGGNWLSANPLSGTTNSFISVRVDPSDLEEGIYHGVVRVTGFGRTAELPVTLNIVSGPLLEITPDALSFTVATGATAPSQTVVIASESGEAIPFQVSTGSATWLNVTPRSGTTLAALSVSVNPQGLEPGVYEGTITIQATGSTTTWTVEVELRITTLLVAVVSPTQINWTALAGDSDPLMQRLSVTGSRQGLSFTATAVPDAWLSVEPDSGTLPAQLTVWAIPTDLAENTYTGSVVIAVEGADNSPLAIPVTLKISPAEPVVGAILHAASLRPGIMAPGTIVSIFGRSLGPEEGAGLEIGTNGKVATSLAGTQVFFDEIPAPLTYAQERQINAVIPYGVFDRTIVRVTVDYNGHRSPAVNLQVSDASPGIFTADSSGEGIGAIINEDGTYNSSRFRARRGTIVSVYGTGGGEMRPPGEDGAIVPGIGPTLLLPVKAFIGGREAEVVYAGPAPGLISGVLQLNIRVPADAPVGLPPLVFSVGDLHSQPGVSVAVE